ncbi:hypothetical protein CNO14_07230 (plasmid) [Borrelia miyamotoi]|uniref:Uncharacterized protein n=2 Tax=Borrelia miyamotoi TaxID=47466 RepID=A0AAQ3HE36_9SPIR|nr:hypothetical protein [Borrelia miyamotoi]AHH05544.1 hypothetical protein BOM_1001 [Borrelia miyamotoi FR64b]WCB91059.1 hypothetical protein CNO11_07405 [Borrelia miyamotoi]WCL22184.1 hypothetical protein CNO10_07390 [Borrelia miyamotoi]WDE70445.1 hypothetical protein CNO12_07565 [Borrelia miyamotoi]WDE71781.1 hypothetical protein CNO13_07280 [Borrelia miyamotoi]
MEEKEIKNKGGVGVEAKAIIITHLFLNYQNILLSTIKVLFKLNTICNEEPQKLTL